MSFIKIKFFCTMALIYLAVPSATFLNMDVYEDFMFKSMPGSSTLAFLMCLITSLIWILMIAPDLENWIFDRKRNTSN